MKMMRKVKKKLGEEDEEIEKKLDDNGAPLDIVDIQSLMAIFFLIKSKGLN